jgi:hypothetical protein
MAFNQFTQPQKKQTRSEAFQGFLIAHNIQFNARANKFTNVNYQMLSLDRLTIVYVMSANEHGHDSKVKKPNKLGKALRIEARSQHKASQL